MPAAGWCLLLAAGLARFGRRNGPAVETSRQLRSVSAPPSGGPAPLPTDRTPTGKERFRAQPISVGVGSEGSRARLDAAGTLAGARTRALAIALGWGLVLLFTAVTLVRTRIYADEQTFWSAATRAEPASGAARVNLGNALYNGGDPEGAAAVYRQALELQLTDPDRALALTNLGSVLYQKGDKVQAEAMLRDAAKLPGADATVEFNLGALLYQNGYAQQSRNETAAAHATLAEAAVHLARAVELDPYHARAWMLLGHCEREAGQVERASEAWKRVIAIDGLDGLVGREAAVALNQID